MSAHTPGPWHIERSGGGWVREVTNKDGRAICYGSIEDADARLISAAPDMYEALKVARECILNRSNVEYRKHGESTPLQDHYEELIAQIDAAMEKAETP